MFTASFDVALGTYKCEGVKSVNQHDNASESTVWAEAHEEAFGFSVESKAFYDGNAKPGVGHARIDARVQTKRMFLIDGAGYVKIIVKGTVSSAVILDGHVRGEQPIKIFYGATSPADLGISHPGGTFSVEIEMPCGVLFPIGFQVDLTNEPVAGEQDTQKVTLSVESILFDIAAGRTSALTATS